MKQSIQYGYQTPEFDTQLSAEAEPIKRDAKKDGAYLAKKNRPAKDEQSLLPYIGQYKARFEELLIKKLDIIKPEVQARKYARHTEQHAKDTSAISTEISDLEHASRIDERTLGGAPKPTPAKSNMLLYIVLGILYAGELFYNALAFAFIGESMAMAYVIGASVTLALGILTHAAGRILARTEELDTKAYLKAAPYLLTALAVVIALSVLRSTMQTSLGHQGASMWVYLLVNIGYIVSAIALSRMALAKSRGQDADREAAALHARIDERTAQIQTLTAKQKELDASLEKAAEEYQFVQSKATRTADILNAHFVEAVEGFKTENLVTRPDLATPVCFFESLPSLKNPIDTN